jgi:hypothetical protein
MNYKFLLSLSNVKVEYLLLKKSAPKMYEKNRTKMSLTFSLFYYQNYL